MRNYEKNCQLFSGRDMIINITVSFIILNDKLECTDSL